MQRNTILLGGAALIAMLGVGDPAFAQLVGGALGDPVTMIGNFARAGLTAMGACMACAGMYKGFQVWSGQRNLYDATTWLLGGGGLAIGTAAAIGFS
jgi:hypothetical protein